MQFLQEVSEGTEVREQAISDQLVNRLDSNLMYSFLEEMEIGIRYIWLNQILRSSSQVLTQIVNPGSNAAMAVSGSAVDRALSALRDEKSDDHPVDEIAVGLIGFTGRRSRPGEGRSDAPDSPFSW